MCCKPHSITSSSSSSQPWRLACPPSAAWRPPISAGVLRAGAPEVESGLGQLHLDIFGSAQGAPRVSLTHTESKNIKSHKPFGLRWFSCKKSSLNPLGKGLPLPLPLSFNRLTRKAYEHLIAASLAVLVASFFALLSNFVVH